MINTRNIAKVVLRTPVAKAVNNTAGVSVMRGFSSLTKEEIDSGLDKVERHRKVVQKTSMPKTMTDMVGTGSDLHIPKNMSEIGALTGMPAEHQNRTVMIQPRVMKTLQSGDLQSYQWQLTWKHSDR